MRFAIILFKKKKKTSVVFTTGVSFFYFSASISIWAVAFKMQTCFSARTREREGDVWGDCFRAAQILKQILFCQIYRIAAKKPTP